MLALGDTSRRQVSHAIAEASGVAAKATSVGPAVKLPSCKEEVVAVG